MTPRNKLLLALPLVAAAVVALAYFQLFTNPGVDAVILVLFIAVSAWNRRKFAKAKGPEKSGRSQASR